MKRNHTPGPWRAGDAGHTVFGPKRSDGSLPASIAVMREVVEGSVGANCRLMAAAPELLEACKTLLAFANSVRPGGGVLRTEREMLLDARAAIAKAEGGAA